MGESELTSVEDQAYRDRIRSNTLSELEDMCAHLDRIDFPQRLQMLRDEIELRLKALDQVGELPTHHTTKPAGFFRRWWAGLVDLFVHLLILSALFLLGYGVISLKSTFAPQDSETMGPQFRLGPSPFQKFATGIVGGEAEAWSNWEQWRKVGLYTLAFLTFKALVTIPAWRRSGTTPGMREAGIGLLNKEGGKISLGKGLSRFLLQYPLFFLTIGVSALWILWDRQKCSLHDRILGISVVRFSRSWELPNEVRTFE
jgi:uncharacterized RDD family membrane protein YckC